MSTKAAVLEPPQQTAPAPRKTRPRGDGRRTRPEEGRHAPPERRGPAGRIFRIIGVLLAVAMGEFLIGQHLLPLVLPANEAAHAAAPPPAPALEDDRKVVV